MRRSAASDWTAGLRGRGPDRLTAVDLASIPRLVTADAFDQFVFDARGVTRDDGAAVVRGVGPEGLVIAVGSMPWPEMPVFWVALQSRRGPDLLGLAGDEMERVGHDRFDDRYAVDADDVSLVRKLFRTSLRDWLVTFDDDHGPLVVLFAGPPEPEEEPTPRRRKTDPAPTAPVPEAASVATVFVARLIADDTAVVDTLAVTAELTEHVRSAVER